MGNCKKTQLKHTLLEVVQVAELYQVVAVVIVGDVDLGVFSQGILHPGSLVASITVLLLWLLDGCYSPFTVEDLPWKKQAGHSTCMPGRE